MRTIFSLACALLASAPAFGQFSSFRDTRYTTAGAHTRDANGELRFEQRDSEIASLAPLDTDQSVGVRAVDSNYARSWQTSYITANEVFVSGGAHTAGPDRSYAHSAARVEFRVGDRLHDVHLTGDITIDPFSFETWSGVARISLQGGNVDYLNYLSVYANTVAAERMDLIPIGAFTIGEDGLAHATFDRTFVLEPGTYDFDAYALSQCSHPGVYCDGQPITFNARMVVMPEPSTWILAAVALLFLLCHAGALPAIRFPPVSR